MNEEFVTIRVQGKDVKVSKQFLDLSDAEQQKFLKDNVIPQISGGVEKMSIGEAALRGASDMFTFGFDDEINGALRALFTGADYSSSRQEWLDAKDRARKDQGGAYLAGQVAGSLPTMFIPGANVARGAQGLKLVGKAALAGAGAGALYGAGSGEGGVGDRLVGSVDDAALGAIAGPLGVGASKVVGRAAGAGGRALGDAVRRVRGQPVQTATERQAARATADILRTTAGSVDDAINEAQRLNVPLGAGSSDTAAATVNQFRMTRDPAARQAAVQVAEDTLGNKRGALAGQVSRSLGAQPGNTSTNVRNSIQDAERYASGLYQQAFRRKPTLSENIQRVVEGLDDDILDLMESRMPQNGIPAWDDQAGRYSAPLPTEAIEETVKALRDLGRTGSPRAAMYRAQGNMIRNMINQEAPDLTAARSAWEQAQQMREAFQAGQGALAKGADAAIDEFRQLPAGQVQDMYRTGIVADIRKRLSTNADESMAVIKKLRDSDAGRSILDEMGRTGGTNLGPLNQATDEFAAAARLSKIPNEYMRAAETHGNTPVRAGRTIAYGLHRLFRGDMVGAMGDLGIAMTYAPAALRNQKPEVQAQVLRNMMEVDPNNTRRALEAFMSGTEAEREFYRSVFENIMNSAAKGLVIPTHERVK